MAQYCGANRGLLEKHPLGSWKDLKYILFYHLTTFGCQMNEHDSERIRGVLEECGWLPASRDDEADLLVFNTCAVRESAESRLLGRLGEARRLKKERPERIIALGGCFARRKEASLFSDLPFLDIAFGPQNIGDLPALVDKVKHGDGPAYSFEDNPFPSAGLPSRRLDKYHAWVQVMTGCTNFCAYCVVPSVRGPERSRKDHDIIEEVEQLAADGVVEITLLGQNVNAYGLDLDGGRDAGAKTFAALLTELNSIDGIERIRFTTSHPKDLGDDLIEALSGLPRVCKHLHLPVQSGSNRILKRMKRDYTREHYMDIVARLYEKVPGLALTTDIIIGFPGEKEDDFYLTLKLVGKCRFDSAFTFIFSPRPGTEAADLLGTVPEFTRKRRMQELVGATQKIAREKNAALVGRTLPVLIEGPSRQGDGLLRGRTDSNKIVNFEPAAGTLPAKRSGDAPGGDPEPNGPAGSIVPVLIESATSTTLKGRERSYDDPA